MWGSVSLDNLKTKGVHSGPISSICCVNDGITAHNHGHDEALPSEFPSALKPLDSGQALLEACTLEHTKQIEDCAIRYNRSVC